MLFQLNIHSFKKNQEEIISDFDWKINTKESWAIIGNIGVGKTTLLKIISGEEYLSMDSGQLIFNKSIVQKDVEFISFSDDKKWIKRSNYYYQQRYYTSLTEDEISLHDFIFTKKTEQHKLNNINALIEKYSLSKLLEIPFFQLSNGQKNKSILIKSLQSTAKIFLLDNPFIGIDSASRKDIFKLIDQLVKDGKHVIYSTNYQDFASSTTNILELNKNKKYATYKVSDFQYSLEKKERIITVNQKPTSENKKIIELRNVTITYGEKTILDHINWQVLKGEKWTVFGENGSGKSTLLSLLYADHPYAYKNEILLFNEPRKNQSIWEIKSRIGYLSSEFHLHFNEPLSVLEVIGTGFFDTLTLLKKLTETQVNTILELLNALQLSHLKNRNFLTLSFGEQRLVLFARAVVKVPELLILDEPYQGLDESTINICNQYIENNLQDVTLIFTSHYIEELPKSINKILHLVNGKIV